ncbi:unnamed protein product [Citrullus colocynthis]|uniref:Uncharacterized protein n=1 Tax=Citrullus colocynthis TaxID=252529 RepID=A0ABP0Z2K2_9ROSI
MDFLKSQNKSRHHRFSPDLALPHTLAVRRWRCGRRVPVGGGGEALDSNRGVEIFLDVGDDPISNGPGVDPGNGAFCVVAFRQDEIGPKWDDRDWCEDKGGGGAGEEAHQVLVRRRTMEPPLQVRGQKAVHRLHVFGTQCLVKGSHSPNALPLLRRPL